MESSPHDRNVFILGAGFSAQAGAPLLNDFLDRSREFKDDPSFGLEPDERQRFEDVFEFRREMAQSREKVRIDLDNIEELFGLVELSRRLRRNNERTRDATVYLIAKTLELAVKAPGNGRLEVVFDVKPEHNEEFKNANQHGRFKVGGGVFSADIYEFFAALACGLFDVPACRATRATAFITFNYDLVLDRALQRLQLQPDYQLTASSLQTSGPPQSGPKYPVLKLHGSANWGVCGKCRKRVLVLPDKLTDSPREFRFLECDRCHKRSFQPLLIPPSWDKSEYHSTMRPVWAKAFAELKAATRICIIGYSMPQSDMFFKYLLTLALSQNHGLSRLVVIDNKAQAGPPPLRERYDQLLDPVFHKRRFIFNDVGFEMFFGSGDRALLELGRGEMLGGHIRCQ